jgi:hypothetical protein
LVSSGEIEAARVGRAVRINRASLMAYMKRSAEEAAWMLEKESQVLEEPRKS